MKRIHNLVRLAALGLVLLTAPACDNILDIEPRQETPGDIALNTADKMEQAIAGVYGPLTTDALYGTNLLRIPELMADNLTLTVGGVPNDPYVLRATNIFTQGNRDVWETAYRVIRNANIIIDYLDRNQPVAGATATDRDRWKGEALTIRALMHYELVRLWGQPWSATQGNSPGVPVRVTVPTGGQILSRSGRNSVAEVYAAVISDLQQASALLANQYEAGRLRVTRRAAQGILAKVYFSQNNYRGAFDATTQALENPLPTLAPITVFRNTGTAAPTGGVIWQLVGVSQGWPSAVGVDPAGPRDLPISQGAAGLAAAFTTSAVDDIRSAAVTTLNSNPYYGKFALVGNPNLPLVRTADILLIRAESGAQLGGADLAAAQQAYDAVRRASVASHVNTALTGQALVTAVRAERRLELALEGDRYHELRRTQQNVRGLAYNSAQLLLKIPDLEIGINPDMQQN